MVYKSHRCDRLLQTGTWELETTSQSGSVLTLGSLVVLVERWGLTWWPLLVGSASETNAWSDLTYLRYTWKPAKTKDCFQLRMKVIGRFMQDSTAGSLTWTMHRVSRWHFLTSPQVASDQACLQNLLREVRWNEHGTDGHPIQRMPKANMPLQEWMLGQWLFIRVIFRFCEAESQCWTMVSIPWKELALSELVYHYHMLQVAAIVGKPSQQFVDQERCDVPKWTENPKMRWDFFGNFTTLGFWQLYNFGVFWRHLSNKV